MAELSQPSGSHRCLCEMPHLVSEFLSVNDEDRGENAAAARCRGPSRCADVRLLPVVGCSFHWREDERIITGARLSAL